METDIGRCFGHPIVITVWRALVAKPTAESNSEIWMAAIHLYRSPCSRTWSTMFGHSTPRIYRPIMIDTTKNKHRVGSLHLESNPTSHPSAWALFSFPKISINRILMRTAIASYSVDVPDSEAVAVFSLSPPWKP